jgi:hypothetical protein
VLCCAAQDADLLLLSLLCHEPYFIVMRENMEAGVSEACALKLQALHPHITHPKKTQVVCACLATVADPSLQGWPTRHTSTGNSVISRRQQLRLFCMSCRRCRPFKARTVTKAQTRQSPCQQCRWHSSVSKPKGHHQVSMLCQSQQAQGWRLWLLRHTGTCTCLSLKRWI